MSQGIMRWWNQRLGRPFARGEIPVTRDEDGDEMVDGMADGMAHVDDRQGGPFARPMRPHQGPSKGQGWVSLA